MADAHEREPRKMVKNSHSPGLIFDLTVFETERINKIHSQIYFDLLHTQIINYLCKHIILRIRALKLIYYVYAFKSLIKLVVTNL